VADYAVVPAALLSPVAYVLPYFELVIVPGMLIPTLRHASAVAALVLLVLFTLALGVNLLRGRGDLDCGCHLGGIPAPVSRALLARNVLFMLWVLPATSARAIDRS